MKTAKVNLTPEGYEIQIGPGILSRAGNKLEEMGFREKAVIITNPTVRGLYGSILEDSLKSAGLSTATLEVPDGEEYKTLEQAGELYLQLNELQAERTTPILALGGGVIGDLAGFAAATYMRGVPLIQVPTTLLAQVDSSIGGKTAVNHGQLKNNIGVFYQPKLVMADTATLKTLPVREIKNGFAEVIKYGVIKDRDLFIRLENEMPRLKKLDEDLLEEVVTRCAGIKAAIVEKDEKDTGLRNILNFGHTIGHAIETVSDYKIKHGQGVAMGMMAASLISYRMDYLPYSALDKIKTVLIRAGLPTNIPGLDIQNIRQAMEHDKKKVGGKLKMVLPVSIGEAMTTDRVTPELIEEALRDLYEETPNLRNNS